MNVFNIHQKEAYNASTSFLARPVTRTINSISAPSSFIFLAISFLLSARPYVVFSLFTKMRKYYIILFVNASKAEKLLLLKKGMIKNMIDFSKATEELKIYKGSEKKKTLIYDNKRYLVKFPDPIREKNKNISYINNAFSEYVGSNI